MKVRPLGSTGINISEVSIGTWAIGGPFAVSGRPIGWGKVDDNVSLDALRRGFELGINFVDTANVYGFGHSEEIVGKAARETKQEIFIASKVGFLREAVNGSIQDFSEGHILPSCEASLKRLGRDRIDLYQLHCVPLDVIRRGDVFSTLDKLKQQGKIRAYGVSINTDQEALAAMQYPGVQCVQIIFNVLRQKPAKTVFPIAKQKKVGILARVPLASGLLTGKFSHATAFSREDHRSNPLPGETFSGLEFAHGVRVVEKLKPLAKKEGLGLAQLALRWILEHEAVTAAIPGAKNVKQVEENASASQAKLSKETMAAIEAIYRGEVAGLVESVY